MHLAVVVVARTLTDYQATSSPISRCTPTLRLVPIIPTPTALAPTLALTIPMVLTATTDLTMDLTITDTTTSSPLLFMLLLQS